MSAFCKSCKGLLRLAGIVNDVDGRYEITVCARCNSVEQRPIEVLACVVKNTTLTTFQGVN